MADDNAEPESKFLKSGRNRQTENAGLNVLLRDGRFQAIDRLTKAQILTEFGASGAPVQAFDAIMTEQPVGPLTALTFGNHLNTLRLVEMKTTRKPIQDDRLEGFFFGVTESELKLAEKLGDRYLFAFVVLNPENVFGTEFYVLLTKMQLDARIRSKRIQYQVTLARGLKGIEAPFGVGPGLLARSRADPQ